MVSSPHRRSIYPCDIGRAEACASQRIPVMSLFVRSVFSCAGIFLAVRVVSFAAAPKVEETIIGPTNAGGAYTVSSTGAHVAFAGMKGQRFYVNVDGVDGPAFDELMKAGGSGFVLPAKAGVWRATQGGMQGGDAPVIFTADGKHHAYVARQGDEYVVIHDGKEVGRGPRKSLVTSLGPAGMLTITPAGKHVFWGEQEFVQKEGRTYTRLVISGQRGPLTQGMIAAAPVFSADESHSAYQIAQSADTGKEMLIVDGKNAGYLGQQPVFTADGSSLLCLSHEQGKPGVLANGKLTYAGNVNKIVVAPIGRRWAAIANKAPAANGLGSTVLVSCGLVPTASATRRCAGIRTAVDPLSWSLTARRPSSRVSTHSRRIGRLTVRRSSTRPGRSEVVSWLWKIRHIRTRVR
jgi:hypothetical protein